MNIYSLLSETEIKKTYKTNYKKGQTLFYENDLCDFICFLISGEIEISSYLIDGEKVIYNHLFAGDSFGGNLLFSSSPYFKGDVKAKADSSIILLHKNDFIDFLQENKKLFFSYLKEENDFAKSLNSQIKLLSMNSAKDRLLFYLENNNRKIKVKNITDLSEKLGLTRETTSRLISKLVKEKVLIYSNRTISIK